jgi:hypothetical protein
MLVRSVVSSWLAMGKGSGHWAYPRTAPGTQAGVHNNSDDTPWATPQPLIHTTGHNYMIELGWRRNM